MSLLKYLECSWQKIIIIVENWFPVKKTSSCLAVTPILSLSATKGLTAQTQKEAMNSFWIFSYLCSDAPNKIRGVSLWVNIVSRSRSGDPPQNSGIRESGKELKEIAKDNSSIYFSAGKGSGGRSLKNDRSGSHYLWPPKKLQYFRWLLIS